MRIENEFIDELNGEIPVSEPSFGDLCELGFFDCKYAKLTIIWENKFSKNKQILLLRRLYTKLKDMSAVDMYKIVCQNEQQWEFAKMGWGMAVDLRNKAQKAGLNIVIEETPVYKFLTFKK